MAPFHPLLTVESHIHFEAPLPCPSGPCNSLPHARTCTRHLSPPRARHPGPRHAFGPTTCTRVYLDFFIFFSLTTSPDSRCTYNVGRTWRMHPTRCLARQKTPTSGHSGRGAGRFRGLDGLMSDCDDLVSVARGLFRGVRALGFFPMASQPSLLIEDLCHLRLGETHI